MGGGQSLTATFATVDRRRSNGEGRTIVRDHEDPVRVVTDATPVSFNATGGDGRGAPAEASTPNAPFLRALGHDLSSPLAIITGMGNTLAERQDALPAEVRVELARAIARHGSRVMSTVENLLSLDRLALGGPQLLRRTTDVAALVRDVVTVVDGELTEVLTHLEPVTASVDPALLERIVENLVRNGVEHQHGSEPVEVCLRHDPDDAGRFELRIMDRGHGIEPAHEELIFQPYFQGTRRGVGLSIVRAFARLHGGDVRVDARPGGGSVFIVSLPLDGDS